MGLSKKKVKENKDHHTSLVGPSRCLLPELRPNNPIKMAPQECTHQFGEKIEEIQMTCLFVFDKLS